jgi:hypothetical protein
MSHSDMGGRPISIARRLRGSLGVACLVPAIAGLAMAGDPQPERVWSDQLTNEGYYNHTVSIGNHGSQVFCDTGYSNQWTRLYSSFASQGAPVWQRFSSAVGFNRHVDSAETTDVHAVLRQDEGATSSSMTARVYVYTSSSTVPIAVHSFDQTDYGAGNGSCSVSDDGRWVVATTGKLNTIHVSRLDMESNNPSSPDLEMSVSRWGPTSQYDTSSDGSRLYLGGQLSGTVLDLNSGATLFSQNYYGGGAEATGHSLSGDGRTLVVTQSKKTRIYRESGGTFAFLTEFDPFPNTTDEVPWNSAVSHDGSIVVTAYTTLPDFQKAHICVWNVNTGQQLMHHVQNGSGTEDNLPNSTQISSNGDRIVIGSYGDSAGLTPEIQVFGLNAGGSAFHPETSFALPGSVFDMDLSSNGNQLAVSTRTTHANSATGSKVIEVYDLGSDLRVQGNSRVNSQVDFEFHAAPGSVRGYLLVADNFSPTQFPFGTLFPERQGLQLLPMGTPSPAGLIEYANLTVQGPVGSTRYFQGYAIGPRQLSKDWAPLTVLP